MISGAIANVSVAFIVISSDHKIQFFTCFLLNIGGIGGIISLCGDNCENTDPPATDEWDTTKEGNYMYNVDEGFPGPRDDFDFDVDGRPRGATKDKDLKDPKAPSMAKDVIVKSPSVGKGSKEPTLGKGTKQPTLGKGTKEPTGRNLQSRKGRKVLRA